jgi:hypothetical protein
MSRLTWFILIGLAQASCGEPCRCIEPKSAATRDPVTPAAATSEALPPAAATQPTPGAGGATPNPPPAGAASLPEMVVRSIGMHIGGGPNDELSKAPYKRVIEQRFEEFRRCYLKIAEPGKVGVIGVDLQVPSAGGKAVVSQPRTGIKGKDFRACVVAVFESIEFDKPAKGATVVSYSMEFSFVQK